MLVRLNSGAGQKVADYVRYWLLDFGELSHQVGKNAKQRNKEARGQCSNHEKRRDFNLIEDCVGLIFGCHFVLGVCLIWGQKKKGGITPIAIRT